jgi:4-amino-4-deoxy-L-arabinose transferase-like glycosyltransferase
MSPEQTKRRKLASVLYSPALAVVAAYSLRMFLLWLSHFKDGTHARLPVTGLEEGLVALSLATGKGFFGPFPGYDAPTAWLAPGYASLWALAIRLTHFYYPASLILLGQTLNCVYSAATCWPIYSIGKKLFGEKVGLASCWLWVFLPFSILMSLEWAWDQCLAGLCLALVVDVTLRLRNSMSPLHWSGYGLLWAAAVLVNPSIGSLLPFLLGWLIFERWRAGIKSPVLYARVVVMCLLAVLPWSIRNYYKLNGWVFVKSNFGVALYVGNHPASLAVDPHPMNSLAERLRLVLEGESQFSDEEQHLAVEFIKSHPGEFVKKTWGRILNTWTAKDDSFLDGWITFFNLQGEDIFLCSLFSFLSFVGLLLALRAYGAEPLPLAFCLILFPLPYYISLGEIRYRHPIDPLLTILTVYAVSWVWENVTQRPAVENLPAGAAA